MKYTLLEMTQAILTSMSSDEVESIDDTVESRQVAEIIKENFFYLIASEELPEHKYPFKLTESSSSTPVLFTIPSTILSSDFFKYKVANGADTVYKDLIYLPYLEFSNMVMDFNESDSNVDTYTATFGSNSFDFKCLNDRPPTYYTTVDDTIVLCDSYDSAVETYLRSSKTYCFGFTDQTFTLADSFTPKLDGKQFQLLLNASKEQCFNELKQIDHAIANKRTREQKINVKRNKNKIPSKRTGHAQIPNLARRV